MIGREVAEMLARLESGEGPDPLRGHYGIIFKEVKKYAGLNPDDILDLFQDVIVTILEKRLRYFDPNRGLRFRSWLRNVARFDAIEKVRNRLGRRGQKKDRGRQFAVDFDPARVCDHRDGEFARVEVLDSVEFLLKKLGPESKALLSAYYGIGEPPATLAEIGRRIDRCEATAYYQYRKAIKRLQQLKEIA